MSLDSYYFMFTKISEKNGIKLFKVSAVMSIVKEYTQLYHTNVVGPENPDLITPKQKLK